MAAGDPTTYRMWWDEDDLVARVVWDPGAACRLEDAVAMTDTLGSWGRGPVPLLVDMRQMSRIDREARDHFSSTDQFVKGVALHADSAVTRMIANFFIGTQRLPVPTRMFTTDSDALAWLGQLR